MPNLSLHALARALGGEVSVDRVRAPGPCVSPDEAKADWPAVILAAMLYGSVFRIHGNRVALATLRRHESNRHPATNYHCPATDDLGNPSMSSGTTCAK
jgi:hypothetical protein